MFAKTSMLFGEVIWKISFTLWNLASLSHYLQNVCLCLLLMFISSLLILNLQIVGILEHWPQLWDLIFGCTAYFYQSFHLMLSSIIKSFYFHHLSASNSLFFFWMIWNHFPEIHWGKGGRSEIINRDLTL